MTNRISIMTMSMLRMVFIPIHLVQDYDEALNQYDEMMHAVSLAGFCGVDVTKWEADYLGVENIRKTLKEYNLSVSSYITFDEYAKSEGLQERIENGKRQADIAKELGTNVLMLVPMAHEGLESLSKEEIHQNMISAWASITSYANRLGLHVVIEDTPDLRLQLCKIEDVKAVMDQVPGLELVYDSGNLILDGEDPIDYIKAFSGRIGFVHLKDIRIMPEGTETNEKMADGRPTGAAPIGTGLIDIPAVIKALEETGYAGGMTVEYAQFDDMNHLESMEKSFQYVSDLL